jgi:hypothetical protein
MSMYWHPFLDTRAMQEVGVLARTHERVVVGAVADECSSDDRPVESPAASGAWYQPVLVLCFSVVLASLTYL